MERGHDAEVAPAAAQAPEQLRVLVRGGHDLTPVGGDHLGLDQVVADEAELALEPTAATAEREAREARGGHPSSGHRESVLLRRGVELAPGQPGLGPHRLRRRVDRDPLHAPHVDRDSGIDHRGAGHSVSTAVDRERQVRVNRGSHCRNHIRGIGTAGEEDRPAVDHAVEHRGPRRSWDHPARSRLRRRFRSLWSSPTLVFPLEARGTAAQRYSYSLANRITRPDRRTPRRCATQASTCIASNSSMVIITERAFEPSLGPTMPFCSSRSIKRPARANPTRSLRWSIDVEPSPLRTTNSIASASRSSSSSLLPPERPPPPLLEVSPWSPSMYCGTCT